MVTKVATDGTITFTGTITSLADTDYLFNAADITIADKLAQGLDAYNPETPSSSFNGVNQQTSELQYAGSRYDGSDDAIETVLGTAIARHLGQGGKKVDVIFMNPVDVDRLSISKVGQQYLPATVESDKRYNLKIEGFKVGGAVVVEDGDCPVNVARGVANGAFKWKTCGPCPMIDKLDGLTIRALSNAHAYEMQAWIYHNFVSSTPRGLLRVKLAAG